MVRETVKHQLRDSHWSSAPKSKVDPGAYDKVAVLTITDSMGAEVHHYQIITQVTSMVYDVWDTDTGEFLTVELMKG